MSEHYYSSKPTTEHAIEKWQFELLGTNMNFQTDRGVFSKKTIDYGSRVLLANIDEESLPTGAFLDIGCGYGALGLTLAKVYQREVEMCDVNERALALAKTNARLNNVDDLVKIYTSDVYNAVEGREFAAIISNPPIRAGKEVVHRVLSEAKDYLMQNGALYVVIQKKQGAPSAKSKMEAVFGNCEIVKKDKGYYILKSIKK